MTENFGKNFTDNLTASLSNETSYYPPTNPTPFQTFLIVVSFMICMAGLFGNVLIARIILSFRAMRTATNWFLLNLAICNLAIVIIIIPYQRIHPFVPWSFGEIGCKYLIMPVMEHFAGVCVLTYTAISFARYAIIRRHTGFVRHSKKKVVMTIAIIWIISFTVLSIMLMGVLGEFNLTAYSTNRLDCRLSWLSYEKRKIYRVCVFVLTFAVPMATTGFSYWKIYYIIAKSTQRFSGHLSEDVLSIRHQKNRQMNTALIKMYVLFAILTLPLQLFLVLWDFQLISFNIDQGAMMFDILTIIFYAQTLSSPYSLLCMSNEYREKIQCTKYFCVVIVPRIRTISSEVRSSFLRRSKRTSQPSNGITNNII